MQATHRRCGAVRCGVVVWCGVVWCGAVRCGVVGVVWCWCGVQCSCPIPGRARRTPSSGTTRLKQRRARLSHVLTCVFGPFVVFFALLFLQEEFLLTPEKLKAALTDKTRMLIFCNPSNPTGAVHSKVGILAYMCACTWILHVYMDVVVDVARPLRLESTS